jgi:hypothetical protein
MTQRNYNFGHIEAAKVFFILLAALSLFSCSNLPFQTKADTTAGAEAKLPAKAELGERLDVEEPKPGDIKVLDGIEYIYTRNKRYMLTPYEQEYSWIRKDQYTPGLGESVMTAVGGAGKQERDALEARLAKLEEEYKNKGIAPQMAYPVQMAQLPQPAAVSTAAYPSLVYPSPKMRRRVIVLPVADETAYRRDRIGEFATRRLIWRLESTNGIVCIDPGGIDMKSPLTREANMKILNEVYGIQAVVKGTMSVKEAAATRTAPTLDIEVYNTETGTILKRSSGGNLSPLSREEGDGTQEKSLMKSVDQSVEVISEELLRSVLTIDWHARIASLETGKAYINAGRQSGLERGAALEVYSPGTEIVDSRTRISLGRTRGNYKGELKVSELFGVDASWASTVKGGGFTATDLVYLKKD